MIAKPSTWLRRPKPLACSFCGRSSKAVAQLIAGPAVHICDACVDQCNRILAGKPTAHFAGWEQMESTDLLRDLPTSNAAADAARERLQAQVDLLRKRGISWAAVGEALSISRQAAWERFS